MTSLRETRRRPKGRAVPAGRGPYDVGCGDIMTDIVEPSILLRLFYPIDHLENGIPMEQRPSWLPSDHYAHGFADIGGVKFLGTRIKKLLENIKLPAHWHGKLSESKTKYPVIIFSHGLGGCRTLYTSICMDIASCGCIVAAVEHRENSACHSFFLTESSKDKTIPTNGNEQQSTPHYKAVDFIKAPYEVDDLRLKQITQRRDECIASLSFLEVLDDGFNYQSDIDRDFDLLQFKGRLDLSSAAICGHSYGGATTIATLSHDKRFKCGVACDPWGYPLSLDTSFRCMDQPMLFINTEKFQFKDNIEHLLCFMPDPMATSGPRQMITIRGMDHQCQTDLGFVFPPFIAKILKMRDKLHPKVAIETNNDAMIAFLSKYISLERGAGMTSFDAMSNPLIMPGHNVRMTPPWWKKKFGEKKNTKKVAPTEVTL
ncbi:platelet-activating factor acetylhydrolase-like [Lytechinus pictus]|uniref:platelet-activating factor acetylhydrolase-like n=1 Tax=Lytechinus pictus TaxID=7653 RepID=UPI0030BA009B